MSRGDVTSARMNRRAFLAGLAASLAAPRAFAQAGGADPWYATLLADRGRHAKAIHLYGDSIARGFALKQFADEVSSSHPMYGFRSIAAMANALLADNGLPHVVAYGGLALTYVDGGYATGINGIKARVASGVIRSGDVVVIEDAGAHGCDPDEYEAVLLDLRRAVTGSHDVTCILMSMFEYQIPPNSVPPSYQWDHRFGGRSMNDAIRAAAEAELDAVGQTLFLDMNSAMDQWRYSAMSIDGVEVMHSDGIHPNVWGQMRMTGEILKIAGLRPYLSVDVTNRALAQENYQALAYGAPSFTASRAGVYATNCLLR